MSYLSSALLSSSVASSREAYAASVWSAHSDSSWARMDWRRTFLSTVPWRGFGTRMATTARTTAHAAADFFCRFRRLPPPIIAVMTFSNRPRSPARLLAWLLASCAVAFPGGLHAESASKATDDSKAAEAKAGAAKAGAEDKKSKE